MEIQTAKDNQKVNSIERGKIETNTDTALFRNTRGIKTSRKTGVYTEWEDENSSLAEDVEKVVYPEPLRASKSENVSEDISEPEAETIEPDTEEPKIEPPGENDMPEAGPSETDNKLPQKKSSGFIGKKVNYDDLKNKKYTTAKADSDGSVAIEAVQTVESIAHTTAAAGGFIRTAVNTSSKGVGQIRTMAKSGIRLGTVRDVGIVATAVKSGVSNLASSTGQQLLKTKIDKSTITDTGTETIKQGLTELRYADNARKAVLNTARTTVKAGRAVKNMPKNTKEQMKRIKKNAERAKKAAEETARVIKKIFTSKTGLIIIGIAALILIFVMLMTSLLSVVCVSVSSLFSWLSPNSNSDGTNKTPAEKIAGYKTQITEIISEKQAEVNAVVDGFVPDRKQYGTRSPITELNQFGNKEIKIDCYDEIIAILAVLDYRQKGDGTYDMELDFSKAEIEEVISRFYNFEYHYEYRNCSHHNCKRKRKNKKYVYYCDVQHKWLYGQVTNYSLQSVIDSYSFNSDEMMLYETYLIKIREFSNG